MTRCMTVIGLIYMFWASQANAFQCALVSGSPYTGKTYTTVEMTNHPDSGSAEGTVMAAGGVKINVSILKVKKKGLWSEGSSPVDGVSLALGIVNPESRLGSDTIAVVNIAGIKSDLNSPGLTISAIGRVSEKSWVQVECRGSTD